MSLCVEKIVQEDVLLILESSMEKITVPTFSQKFLSIEISIQNFKLNLKLLKITNLDLQGEFVRQSMLIVFYSFSENNLNSTKNRA